MKTENLKKIPYYLSVALLALGASITLGLLSFGGMFSLWPIWSLALATVALSASYEGEIYIQNIKGGLNKLFLTPEFLKNHLGNEFLHANFPHTNSSDSTSNKPQFFIDYEDQLLLLYYFKNKKLTKEDKKRKKIIENNLAHMEQWFTKQLFLKRNKKHDNLVSSVDYAKELRDWLDKFKAHELKKVQDTFIKRRQLFIVVGAFSLLSAGLMGIGTTYLLSEMVAVIPLLTVVSAAIPPIGFIILATIAGAAYGLLIYNAVTDMINNKTLQNLFKQLTQIKDNRFTWGNLLKTIATIILVLLAIALTACTAGTWWAVARESTSLLSGLMKLPGFIMKIINPIVIGISSLCFNWQNTAETLELTEKINKGPITWIKESYDKIKKTLTKLPQHEHWLQIINPARIILKLTITPLRIIFFLGHLISIAVIGDRIPGIPQIFSTLLGFINEGFEDAHYFLDDDNDDDTLLSPASRESSITQLLDERFHPAGKHNDLPTWILKEIIFKPVYWLAIVWDFTTSQLNGKTHATGGPRKLSLSEAAAKQTGKYFSVDEPKDAAIIHSSTTKSSLSKFSPAWQKEYKIMQIEQFKQAHFSHTFIGRALMKDKIECLSQLQTELQQIQSNDINDLKTTIKNANDFEVNGVKPLKAHRHHHFFSKKQITSKTASETFLTNLTAELDALSATC